MSGCKLKLVMNFKYIFLAVVLIGFAAAGKPAAWAASAPSEPILRLETGMHTAPIWGISVDAKEKYLVTSSDDKTVRVWDLGSGRLLRVLRPPIGPDDEGKLYSVAISPDGRTVACGGHTLLGASSGHATIYIFDRGTGRLLRRLTGLPNVIHHLAFSSDGKYLACGSGGVRVFSMPDYKLVFKDADYGQSSYWVDFNQHGRMATVCFDGYIRLYDKGFRKIAQKKAPGGSRPYSAVFSPDGTRIAVGFDDSVKVNVLSVNDLSLLYSPDTSGLDYGNVGNVCWSKDGRYLYAAGRYIKNSVCPIIKWANAGQGARVRLPGPNNTITHLRPLKNQKLVFGSGDPAWGVVASNGIMNHFKRPATSDYRGLLGKLKLSSDGNRVSFGFEYEGKSPAVFSIEDRSLTLNSRGKNLNAPLLSAQGLQVTEWEDSYTPKLNGKKLKMKEYEISRSLAVSPDGKGFLLGTEWYLRFFDRQGREKWKVAAPEVAWAVNIAANGKVAAAGFGDGTIRWYRMSDGKELLAFFPHRNKKRWVLWTPSGYYDASPGGDELVGWHVNRGVSHEADFFPSSRFRKARRRPDVVARVLETLDESRAVKLADAEIRTKKREQDLRKILPPVVTILSPRDGTRVASNNISIRYNLRSPSGEKINNLRVLVDGRPASGARGIVRQRAHTEGQHEIKITIPKKDVEISLIAENRHAAGEPTTVRLFWAGASPDGGEGFSIKPKLYVLAVGVSGYRDSSLVLKYAAKDAKDFTDVVRKQKGRLYRDVTTRLITDGQVTRDSLLDGLDWILKETTSKDVAMIFLAGHGVNDDYGDYYFLPGDVDLDRLRRTGLPFSEIEKTAAELAGKALFFVDTCHSGNILGGRRNVMDVNALVNELASTENGAVVFASSTGRQYSLEDSKWGNGAFTKALVEGFSGKADYQGRGRITINMLDLYLSERVKQLTGGRQTPTTAKPRTIQDFPIALVK